MARFRARGPGRRSRDQACTPAGRARRISITSSRPIAHLPRPQFTFHTTPGRAATSAAFAEPYQPQPVPTTDVNVRGREASLARRRGPSARARRCAGEGLPAARRCRLVWGRLRRQPRQRQRLRAERERAWRQLTSRRRRPARRRRSRFPTISAACTRSTCARGDKTLARRPTSSSKRASSACRRRRVPPARP